MRVRNAVKIVACSFGVQRRAVVTCSAVLLRRAAPCCYDVQLQRPAVVACSTVLLWCVAQCCCGVQRRAVAGAAGTNIRRLSHEPWKYDALCSLQGRNFFDTKAEAFRAWIYWSVVVVVQAWKYLHICLSRLEKLLNYLITRAFPPQSACVVIITGSDRKHGYWRRWCTGWKFINRNSWKFSSLMFIVDSLACNGFTSASLDCLLSRVIERIV